jgi:alkyl sulfatase BDS1-like metallo-beta-lactamase superfamily hydrolase
MRFGKAAALLLIFLAACLGACSRSSGRATGASDASATVVKANAEVAKTWDLSDPPAFADARRGFIAAPQGQVKDAAGNVVWDFGDFAFVKGPAPSTVNPSLWRQALLNNQVGLFKVTEGIWQLRGFDLANITLIQGKTGWIVVDTLTCRETAAFAMAFARARLGDQKVSAVIFTHSHVDHFGGVLGVISAEEAKARNVPVVAPAGFMEEATSENVLLGTAMGRRAMYMYGVELPPSAVGRVDDGLGKGLGIGRVGILTPTVVVEQPRQELTLDGVRFVFYNVPATEAPSEFVFAVPDLRAFGGAEMMSHTLHNLYTLRGAKVRDAMKWADFLDQSLSWVGDADVIFTQHHWPVWGREQIRHYLVMQRDAFSYIHDQSVRLMNSGFTGPEVAETLELPKTLRDDLDVHGYYGTVRHNARAVCQFYLGWFDANPANLDQLPPVDAGKRYVKLAGGVKKVVAAAQRAYDAGEYRWAAELLKHAVYAEPKNKAAAELLAKTFDQMGYLAESGPWRNFYLTGALELRHGRPHKGNAMTQALDLLQNTPVERFLERMAASLDGPKAGDSHLKINLVFSDLGDSYVLWIENAVLHFKKAPAAADAAATLTLTKAFYLRMMTGEVGGKDLLLSNQVKIDGSKIELGRFFALFEKANELFPIVTR